MIGNVQTILREALCMQRDSNTNVLLVRIEAAATISRLLEIMKTLVDTSITTVQVTPENMNIPTHTWDIVRILENMDLYLETPAKPPKDYPEVPLALVVSDEDERLICESCHGAKWQAHRDSWGLVVL